MPKCPLCKREFRSASHLGPHVMYLILLLSLSSSSSSLLQLKFIHLRQDRHGHGRAREAILFAACFVGRFARAFVDAARVGQCCVWLVVLAARKRRQCRLLRLRSREEIRVQKWEIGLWVRRRLKRKTCVSLESPSSMPGPGIRKAF
jgi:hypothetical protein